MFERTTTQHEYDMRAAILDATNDLLRAYSYSQLTVKDICRVAEISAPTFYRYFSDKYAIAEWALTDFMRAPMLAMAQNTPFEGNFRVSCAHIRQYKHFFRKAYALDEDGTLNELNAQMMEQEIYRIFKHHGIARTERLDFQIRYTSRMIPAMTARWLASDLALPDEEIARLLADAIPRQLRELYDPLVSDANRAG